MCYYINVVFMFAEATINQEDRMDHQKLITEENIETTIEVLRLLLDGAIDSNNCKEQDALNHVIHGVEVLADKHGIII